MDNEYGGEEKRRHSRTLADIEDAFDRKLREHEAREIQLIEGQLAALKLDAFPEGAYAHKLAHQAMIDAARSQTEFWQTLKTEVVTKSIWGIIRILGILIIAGLAVRFGMAPVYLAWLSK